MMISPHIVSIEYKVIEQTAQNVRIWMKKPRSMDLRLKSHNKGCDFQKKKEEACFLIPSI